MVSPEEPSEAWQFSQGVIGVLGNLQTQIDLLTERIEAKAYLYPGMEATYRGMLAGWRICETALLEATKEGRDAAG